MLLDKQTYFENHHHQKSILPGKQPKSNIYNFPIFSSFLIARCSTGLR